MIDFLISSIIASVAITVVLNVTIRAFPGTSAHARARQVFGEEQARPDEMPSADDANRFRFYFPWRQMIVWSMGIAILLEVIQFLN